MPYTSDKLIYQLDVKCIGVIEPGRLTFDFKLPLSYLQFSFFSLI